MEAEEREYAALMAQAKSSLARIKAIEEGFGKVQAEQNAREGEQTARTKDLLSRIEAEAELRVGEPMEIAQEDVKPEEEDHTMEENEQVGREDHMEEDDRMEMAADGPDPHSLPPTNGLNKPEGSNFPELMERAKKLLAEISMDGDGQATPKEPQAPGTKEMWTEEESDAFWNSM